jgi:hypothetical protein
MGARLAVGTSGGDGIEGVRDGNDAGPERNLVSGQPTRVSLSVQALVMVTDDGHQITIIDHGLDHVCPITRMPLDHGELLLGQPVRLVEDRAWGVELADVMQSRGQPDLADLRRRKIHPPGDE